MQSRTNELEADLGQLLALKQQVGTSPEPAGPQEPGRGVCPSQQPLCLLGRASSRPASPRDHSAASRFGIPRSSRLL